jgi:hypothetical protein
VTDEILFVSNNHDPAGPEPDPFAAFFAGKLDPRRLKEIMRALGLPIGGSSSRSGGPGPKRRPRRKGGEDRREPVELDNPEPLSGGAAAPLDYDD